MIKDSAEIAPGVRLANPAPPGYDWNAELAKKLADQGISLNGPPKPDIKREVPPGPPQTAPGAQALPLPAGGWGMGAAGPTPARNVPLVDPRLQAQMAANTDAEIGAIGGRQEAQRNLATAEQIQSLSKAEGLVGEEIKSQEGQADIKKRAKEREEHSEMMLKHIDDESAKLAEEKIDPRRYWNDSSTFDKVRFSIANVLGGFLMGFQHRNSNPFADELEARMRADVDAQKANFEIHKGRVSDMKSLYAQAYEATKDKDKAYDVAVGMGLEQAKIETQRLAEQSQSQVYKARGEVLASELEERKKQVAGGGLEQQAKMNKYVPATSGGGGVDPAKVLKRAQEIADKAAEHGIDMSPQDARRRAYIEATGRDPYGAEVNKAVPLPGYQKGGGGMVGTGPDAAALATIAKLPEKQQKAAMEEFQSKKSAGQALKYGNSVYENWGSRGPLDRRNEVDANTMALELKGMLGPGFSSDKDFDTLKTYMPAVNDSAATLAYKRQQFQGFVARHSASPTLDAFGIAPKVEGMDMSPKAAAAGGFTPGQ